ncbi:conserved hypothetical protein [Ricinus communis]|uniref:PB1-like domain-containing protein n=1 Tax=Ricinus communis TaxID=3988 RepID=B9SUA4_RICCO|nr:conserved hypothetical protein [Ricinus communis]
MDDSYVELIIHHKGKVITSSNNRYVRGEMTVVEEYFDLDLLSYRNMVAYVKKLGHVHFAGLYYKGGLSEDFILLTNDRDVCAIGSKLCSADTLDIFVQHCELPGISVEHDSQLWSNVENSAFEDNGEPHQTFNEFLFHVDLLTNDKDDELKEAMENVRKARNRRFIKIVNRENGEEITIDDVRKMEEVEDDNVCGLSDNDESNSPVYLDSDDMGFVVVKYAVMKDLAIRFVKNKKRRVRAHCKEKCS